MPSPTCLRCHCIPGAAILTPVRIIVADCSAEYTGRLSASLPKAKRVLLIKADLSCLIFSELGSYKPLNWMIAPCSIREIRPDEEYSSSTALMEGEPPVQPGEEPSVPTLSAQVPIDRDLRLDEEVSVAPDALVAQEEVTGGPEKGEARPRVQKVLRISSLKSSDVLTIKLYTVYSDQTFDLGRDPGLIKDGVEDHLQRYLAEQIERIGPGARLVRREYPTAIGPVDIMALDGAGQHVAIEIKRHGGIDGVEQLTRYCRLLNRDPLLAPVRGIYAAQSISPQARTLAEDRGFTCLILDYEDMKDTENTELTLFD